MFKGLENILKVAEAEKAKVENSINPELQKLAAVDIEKSNEIRILTDNMIKAGKEGDLKTVESIKNKIEKICLSK